MWISSVLMACAVPFAFAAEGASFTLAGKKESFKEVPPLRILVSNGCVRGGEARGCQAAAALQKATLLGVAKTFTDPEGACVARGGRVSLGFGRGGSENLFCTFSDGSSVDARGLYAMAVRNDEERRR